MARVGKKKHTSPSSFRESLSSPRPLNFNAEQNKGTFLTRAYLMQTTWFDCCEKRVMGTTETRQFVRKSPAFGRPNRLVMLQNSAANKLSYDGLQVYMLPYSSSKSKSVSTIQSSVLSSKNRIGKLKVERAHSEIQDSGDLHFSTECNLESVAWLDSQQSALSFWEQNTAQPTTSENSLQQLATKSSIATQSKHLQISYYAPLLQPVFQSRYS